MKYLEWLKSNINLVSFVIGVVFIACGYSDAGDIIINKGAML